MGWGKWSSDSSESAETIESTVKRMHDEQDDGPLPGTEDSK